MSLRHTKPVRPDPLDLGTRAFEGNVPRERIQELLDNALSRLGQEPSPETYSRACSSLIALRKDARRLGYRACTEIAMLEVITAKADWPRWVDFKRAAAMASESLRRRERPEDTP